MPHHHALNVIAKFAILAIVTALAPAAFADDTADEMTAEAGKEIYEERCASCHGISGVGDGPAAPSMKVAPADLTRIAERAGGAFPSPHIIEVITYGGNIEAHGSATMPIWGRVFSDEGGRGRGGGLYSRRAVLALKRYLETIQK